MISLPELAANGSDDFRIYGAANLPSSGCIVWPSTTPTNGQVLQATGTTDSIDGRTCQVTVWATGGGGGGGAVDSVDGRTGVVTLADLYAPISHGHSGVYEPVDATIVRSSGAKTENAIVAYDADGKIIASGCKIENGALSCGDGSLRSGFILPELAINGTNEFRIYGAGDLASDACIVWPMVAPTQGQVSPGRACCIADLGTADTYNWPLQTRFFRWWGEGGGGNQTEFRWSQLLNFLTRGHTGRYMHVAHAIRQQAEVMLPHSDGFNWRDRPQFGQPGAELDGFGFPTATSANSSLGFKNWMASGVDAGEHTHWWGMIDYYYLSGDETIKDALLDGPKDYYMTRYTYQNGKAGESTQSKGGNGRVTVSADGYTVTRNSGTNFQTSWGVGHNAGIFINGYAYNVASVESENSLTLMQPAPPQTNVNYSIMGGPHNTRSTGLILQGAARFGAFLRSIGDPDADEVLLTGRNVFRAQLRPHLCMSGYPEGCDPGNLSGGPFFTGGISRKRGIHQTHKNSGISEYCSVSVGGWRANIHFQTTTMAHGLWEFRQVMGPEWEDYWLALDLATGLVQWTILENYGYDGTGNWQTNGFRRYVPLDHPADPECDTVQWPAQDAQSMWLSFWFYHQIFGKTDWEPKMKLAMHRMMASLGLRTADFGQFHLMSAISSVLYPGSKALINVPFSLQDNGGGSYTLTWTVPEGAEYYRIKWSRNRIVDWIGYDALTNDFIGDAASEDNWFAAENAPDIPAPTTAGTPQSITIQTNESNLTTENFSVRAWALSSEEPPPPDPTARSGFTGAARFRGRWNP